jgi:hypothetical protein
MRRTTVRELQTRLQLDEASLRQLLDHGQLDEKTLDPQVLAVARRAILDLARRRKPRSARR